jgi:murein DD-endopeptidase MepM/ murein hydrolase activator NlpD
VATDAGPERFDAETAPAEPDDPSLAKLKYVHVTIRSTLEGALVAATGKRLGPALAQVAKRSMVWSVDPRKEIWRGDRLELVYETPMDGEPIIHAFWYWSRKLGETVKGVLYRTDGSKFARYYHPDGREVELRLKDSPMKVYEQITSLLKDGRRHRGVDFKAPIGTPVYSPFSGKVRRKNWATRANGNSIDIQKRRSKVRAYFLHLDTIAKGIRLGTRVKKGQLIGYAGNTGRSTAPHLHYQLQRGRRGRIIDPFDFHRTWRARLPDSEVANLRALFEKYGRLRTELS